MFGKIMSISDELMFVYFEHITDIEYDVIESYKNIHPMEAKNISYGNC